MFKRLRDRAGLAVSSSEGHVVECRMPLKEGSVIYEEGGRSLGLEAYYPASWPEDVGQPVREPTVLNIVVPVRLEWSDGGAAAALEDHEKRRVLGNIRSALAFLGTRIEYEHVR